MVRSSSCGLMPRPTDAAPCGSKSTMSTWRPYSASAAARLMVVVVLPTPPFWLHIAMTRAGPCDASGGGLGEHGQRPPDGVELRVGRLLAHHAAQPTGARGPTTARQTGRA